jgi:hypothetical protein
MCKECDCQSDEGCSCDVHGRGGCDCGWDSNGFVRRYQTKAEQIADLEDYLGELKTEVQAVEEHLADLRK